MNKKSQQVANGINLFVTIIGFIICISIFILFFKCCGFFNSLGKDDLAAEETTENYSESDYDYDYDEYEDDIDLDEEETEEDEEIIDYKIVSTDKFVAYNGELCKSYRVVVDKNATDSQLEAVYYDIRTSLDPITVWFYSDEKLAKGGDMYDVAMMDDYEILER